MNIVASAAKEFFVCFSLKNHICAYFESLR